MSETISEKKGNKLHELFEASRVFEKELLSVIWFDKDKSIIASSKVNVSDFRSYRPHFEVVIDCHLNNKNITFEFQSKKLQYSDFLEIPSLRRVDDICRDLVEVANAIRLFATLESAASCVPSEKTKEFASEIQQAIIKSISTADREQQDIDGLISEFSEKQKIYIDKFKNGTGIIGISTGYPKLDDAVDGLRPEHLWVIGAYTSMGKTFAAINIAAELVRQGKHVVFYSLEMGRLDILSRLLGIMTKENGNSILKGYPHDKEKVAENFELIRKSGFTVHSDIFEIGELQFSMYEENVKKHVDLFIIDFMQLIRVKGSEREYETLTIASTTLQQTAKTLQAPIIVLSQVSNDSAKNSDPVVMGFKGSGSIAAAADLAIEIQIGEDDKSAWKLKMHNGEMVKMKWNIRKNRHGRTGFIDMLFQGRTGLFLDAVKVGDDELTKFTQPILPVKDISADDIDI